MSERIVSVQIMIFDGKRVTAYWNTPRSTGTYILRVWRKKLRDSKAVRILPSSIFVPPVCTVIFSVNIVTTITTYTAESMGGF